MLEVTNYNNERKFIFHNWSKEDFTGQWDGIPTLVKSGETIEVPMFKAYHFTKHLVDREMMKNGFEGSMSSQEARQPYEDMSITEITASTDSPALVGLKEQIAEEIAIESGTKKRGRKIVPKDAKTAEVKVKEFEDIK